MKVLALDLGIATGYAVLDGDENILTHGVLGETNLIADLSRISNSWYPDVVLLEAPVTYLNSGLGHRLKNVVHSASTVFRDGVKVTPAQWKPVTSRTKIELKHITPHERDAIRICLWYLRGPWHTPVAS